MKFTFDREKTDKLLFAFFNATKIPISLFDLDFLCISSFDEMPAYCKNILSTKGFENSCAVCDNNHFNLVTKTKKTMIYTCHAGICEVLAPVMYGDKVIAYLMLGRFRDEEHVYSSEEKITRIAERRLLRLARGIFFRVTFCNQACQSLRTVDVGGANHSSKKRSDGNAHRRIYPRKNRQRRKTHRRYVM